MEEVEEAALLPVAPTLRSGKRDRPVQYRFFRRSNFLAIRDVGSRQCGPQSLARRRCVRPTVCSGFRCRAVATSQWKLSCRGAPNGLGCAARFAACYIRLVRIVPARCTGALSNARCKPVSIRNPIAGDICPRCQHKRHLRVVTTVCSRAGFRLAPRLSRLRVAVLGSDRERLQRDE
jgi:hypothetical protein